MTALVAVGALVLGFALAFLFLRALGAGGAEQLAEVLVARARDSFKAAAGEAFGEVSGNLVTLAEQKLGGVAERVRGDLARDLEPLRELLDRYDRGVREFEDAWREEQGNLKSMLSRLSEATDRVASVLANPRLRGRWGEVTLRRVVELAGMTSYCDFSEQVVSEDGSRLRADLVVHLPGGREVVVDAKVPLDAYYRAVEAPDGEARKAALREHAQAVRKHALDLARRGYAERFRTDGYVVMFVPSESVIGAAVEEDPSLVEDAMKANVFLASPGTLAVLLLSAARSWREQKIAENVREIQKVGSELLERCRRFAEHFSQLHDGLAQALEAYNRAVGSWQSRLLPGVSKLVGLGIASEGQLPGEVGPVEVSLREPPGV